MDTSPVHHRASVALTLTPRGNLEPPIDLNMYICGLGEKTPTILEDLVN